MHVCIGSNTYKNAQTRKHALRAYPSLGFYMLPTERPLLHVPKRIIFCICMHMNTFTRWRMHMSLTHSICAVTGLLPDCGLPPWISWCTASCTRITLQWLQKWGEPQWHIFHVANHTHIHIYMHTQTYRGAHARTHIFMEPTIHKNIHTQMACMNYLVVMLQTRSSCLTR
jgi:hypothetical protein